jgi:beta-galactosidase
MKQKIAFLGFFISCLALVHAEVRNEVNINSSWQYAYGELSGAESTTYNSTQWTTLNLPHTWNAFDGQDGITTKNPTKNMMRGDYARGTGWYRKSIQADLAWQGKQVYIQFDGANRRTDVFVNGILVGTHIGGNSRFRFDISKALHLGESNLIAVRVNNEDNESIPHSADFTFCGGIYRDLSLLITNPVQIETMDYASPGVYLKEALVTDEKAQVEAIVKVANHTDSAVSAHVHIQILDAANKVVTEGDAEAQLVAQGKGKVMIPLTVLNPHLWNGRSDPYLYHANIELSAQNQLTDSIVQPLGLRYFKVDPNMGFILNGKHLDLHGVARHQDRINKGWAISKEDDTEDFNLIKEVGATAIRVAHYQQSQLWYTQADQTGIVMWSEVPFVDEALPSAEFFNNALDQMRELIRQNYNHPAICFWGCGNENSDYNQQFVEGIGIYGPIAERLIQALHAEAKSEDPTRLTTYASYHTEEKYTFNIPGMAKATFQGQPQRWYTDVTAFNKYFGWYYGEPSDAGKFLDGLHTRYPSQCIGVSEYGAGAALTQHEDVDYSQKPPVAMNSPRANAFAKIHPEEYQGYYHEETWKAFSERPYIWVKFVWNMFDFASDFRNEGDTPGRNDKGLVSYDRKTRKDAFYFYKASWSNEPVVRVTSSRFVTRTNALTNIKIYSNAKEVELSVNGVSLGKKPVDNSTVVWKAITLKQGTNTIHAEAIIGGKTYTDECTWNLK